MVAATQRRVRRVRIWEFGFCRHFHRREDLRSHLQTNTGVVAGVVAVAIARGL